MTGFLFILSLSTLLVVGGTFISLRLHTRELSNGRLWRNSQRVHPTLVDYTTSTNTHMAYYETSHYARKVVVISVITLVVLSALIINAISSVLR